MNKKFSHVLLTGRLGVKDVPETLTRTYDYLTKQRVDLTVESTSASLIDNRVPVADINNLPSSIDLIIVIGGDGSLINAAHSAIKFDIPIMGIHRGRLGFLTDIPPNELNLIGDVLSGDYLAENRSFFISEYIDTSGTTQHAIAVNDVVLMPGEIAHMIEFDTFANGQLVYEHRADGLIIATPTGSTAYALSGGGPIVHPTLNATVLVPMFPHTLSSRPIVIDASSAVRVRIHTINESPPCLSFDGRNKVEVQLGSDIHIKQHTKRLKLIHPKQYSYYQILREKLGWERRARRTNEC